MHRTRQTKMRKQKSHAKLVSSTFWNKSFLYTSLSRWVYIFSRSWIAVVLHLWCSLCFRCISDVSSWRQDRADKRIAQSFHHNPLLMAWRTNDCQSCLGVTARTKEGCQRCCTCGHISARERYARYTKCAFLAYTQAGTPLSLSVLFLQFWKWASEGTGGLLTWIYKFYVFLLTFV